MSAAVVEEEDCGAGRGFRRWWIGRRGKRDELGVRV